MTLRLAGVPLFSRPLAAANLWAATTGLGSMVAGFMVLPHQAIAGRTILVGGGLLAAGGAYLFIYNIWRTLGAAPEPARRAQPTGRALPVR